MTESGKNPPEPKKEESEAPSFPFIAIGASAGGLEALEAFFDHVRPDMGAAFVVIQHISPTAESLLGELLKKHTSMKILEIGDGMRAKPDHVYLNPPGKDVGIFHSVFHLDDSRDASSLRLPIDHFFRSLAKDQREQAICIILSGTGSDGTQGLKAIKEGGGLALAQEVRQAKYGSMPASAIATDLVDQVLPVEKMAKELVSYLKHPYLKAARRPEKKEKESDDTIHEILALVRSHTGNDFSSYKTKTIHRRIERRMAVHRIESAAHYLHFLQRDATEVDTLFQELLIGVTQFFREPAAFEALKEKAIPKLLERESKDSPVRVWVPGCSSGEEALTLAMLFIEAMEERRESYELQVFATDLDAKAIDRARKGEYPASIAADVSEERLKRFFTKKNGIYKVKNGIRERIVYAVHNLLNDPPFPGLDLISCRNVLIYMDSALQKKLISLFHYALNPTGCLLLGSSETVGNLSSHFSVFDSKWKIYWAKKNLACSRDLELVNTDATARGDFSQMKENISMESAHAAVDRLLVSEYAPATVLINDKYDTLYLRGPANRYLELPTGRTSLNLLKIVRPGIAFKVPSALHKAVTEKIAVTVSRVQVKQNGTIRTVDITIRPLPETGTDTSRLFVVIFEEVPAPGTVDRKKNKLSSDDEQNRRIAELESELQTTKQNLQTTIQELGASNEELKSANEELQSTNEEVQSTNEELVTAREELQSTNEELITVNSELQSKVDELSQLNNDTNNLFASTEIGMIFLDNDLRIKRFTPHMKRLFNLIPADVGRSLSDITSKISFDEITENARSVLETLQASEKQVQTGEGQWFSMRILPYRTTENLIDGVTITFLNITDLKRLEFELRRAKRYEENIVNTVREPLLSLDGEFRVVSASRSFYRYFKTSVEETVGELVYDLGNGQWDIPELRRLLEQVVPERQSFDDFVVEHDFPSIGHRRMLLNARRIEQENGEPELILLAMEAVPKD